MGTNLAMFQHLLKNRPKRMEAVRKNQFFIKANGFEIAQQGCAILAFKYFI